MNWLLPLALAATIQATPQRPHASAVAPAERRAQLDRIARHCHLPASVFIIAPDGSLHFRPSSRARYQDVDCSLRGVRAGGIWPDMPMGFVGNEAAH
jgi:hypothetical protein